jgi:hypothetical protein
MEVIMNTYRIFALLGSLFVAFGVFHVHPYYGYRKADQYELNRMVLKAGIEKTDTMKDVLHGSLNLGKRLTSDFVKKERERILYISVLGGLSTGILSGSPLVGIAVSTGISVGIVGGMGAVGTSVAFAGLSSVYMRKKYKRDYVPFKEKNGYESFLQLGDNV